jgi:hypothetical protein
MITNRLITVQGPSQLLNVISVLRYQEEFEGIKNCQDVLLIGGLYLDKDDPGSQKLFEACLEISKIWNFCNYFISTKIENFYQQSDRDLAATCSYLKDYLNLPVVDCIYTVRNWQFFNEVCLASYPTARKICYGDGYGIIDLNCTVIEQPISSNGYIQMDEAYLVQPGVECTERIFDTLPIKLIDFQFHGQTIYDSAHAIPGFKAYCETFASTTALPSVVLTSNNTEAGVTSTVEAEIYLYLSSILPYAREDEIFWIKGHPRETKNQSNLLAKSLQRFGFSTSVFSSYQQLPIELFSIFIPIQKAYSLSSSSCIPLSYLNRCELVIGFGEIATRRYIQPIHQDLSLAWEPIFARLAWQGYDHDFKPIRYPEIEQEINSLSPQKPKNLQHQYAARISADQPEVLQTFLHPKADQILLEIDPASLNADLQWMRQTLEDTQSKLRFSEEIRLQLKVECEAKKTEADLLRSQFNSTQKELEMTQTELIRTQQQIKAMQSSKFWQLRLSWIKIKKILWANFRD